jgi:glycerate kinase
VSDTAVIEMAAASGLHLLPSDKRNPLKTTTYGTGELVKASLDDGVSRVVVGVGGSATVDGGTGMAEALGVRFIDSAGEEVRGCGGNLARIDMIDMSGLDPRAGQCAFEVACDVTNPLCGERGAAAVYGPQKGATPRMVEELERGLGHLARVIKRDIGIDVAEMAGAGAAGGLAAGFVAFLGAELRSGVELLIETVRLEEKLRGADLLITGEGKLDEQTLSGKLPLGVARLAAKYGIPAIAIAGAFEGDQKKFHDEGFATILTIAPRPVDLETSFENASSWIADAAERAMCKLRTRPAT